MEDRILKAIKHCPGTGCQMAIKCERYNPLAPPREIYLKFAQSVDEKGNKTFFSCADFWPHFTTPQIHFEHETK